MLNRLKNVITWGLFLTIALFYTSNCIFAQVKSNKTQVRLSKKKVTRKFQKPVCKVNDITFKCPDDFLKPEILDKNTALLKRNYKGSITYLVVFAPN